MRILMFGGSGRLGTAMRAAWKDRHEIMAPGQADVAWTVEGLTQLMSEAHPDMVVNLVAYNNVDGAEGEGRDQAFQVNAELPRVTGEAAKAANVPLIHFSSDYVFAGDKVEGYTELDTPAPISVYGASKLAGEEHVLETYPTGAYIVRTSRLYGDRAEGADYSKPSFPEIIVGELKAKPSFAVNDFEVSAPTSVSELAAHIEKHLLLDRPEPGIYHMSNEGGATWYEWALEIRDQLKYTNELTRRDPALAVRPAKRPAYSVLRSTKLPSMLPWREALANYLKVWRP